MTLVQHTTEKERLGFRNPSVLAAAALYLQVFSEKRTFDEEALLEGAEEDEVNAIPWFLFNIDANHELLYELDRLESPLIRHYGGAESIKIPKELVLKHLDRLKRDNSALITPYHTEIGRMYEEYDRSGKEAFDLVFPFPLSQIYDEYNEALNYPANNDTYFTYLCYVNFNGHLVVDRFSDELDPRAETPLGLGRASAHTPDTIGTQVLTEIAPYIHPENEQVVLRFVDQNIGKGKDEWQLFYGEIAKRMGDDTPKGVFGAIIMRLAYDAIATRGVFPRNILYLTTGKTVSAQITQLEKMILNSTGTEYKLSRAFVLQDNETIDSIETPDPEKSYLVILTRN